MREYALIVLIVYISLIFYWYFIDTLKLYFGWKFNPKMDTIRAFLSKVRILFQFFQRVQGRPPLFPISCAPVSVTEYAPVSLNMTKYPWECLIKQFLLCQGSEYAWSSYIFHRFLNMPRVLNKWNIITYLFLDSSLMIRDTNLLWS